MNIGINSFRHFSCCVLYLCRRPRFNSTTIRLDTNPKFNAQKQEIKAAATNKSRQMYRVLVL